MLNCTAEQGFALVIRTDGDIRKIDLSQEPGILTEVYEQLDCPAVAVVRLTERMVMWYATEGARSRNVGASLIARHYGHTARRRGHVLICGVNTEGRSVNLTGHQVAAVLSSLLAELNPQG